MTNLQDAQIAARIARLVDAELPLLTDHLRSWVEAPRTKPREISVSSDLDRMRFVHVWIVTEDIGERDSSSNVVYDPEPDCFGLVMKLENELDPVSWTSSECERGLSHAPRRARNHVQHEPPGQLL